MIYEPLSLTAARSILADQAPPVTARDLPGISDFVHAWDGFCSTTLNDTRTDNFHCLGDLDANSQRAQVDEALREAIRFLGELTADGKGIHSENLHLAILQACLREMAALVADWERLGGAA